MAKIVEINVEDVNRWNDLVKSFKEYDVYYLNEYVLAFMNEDEKNGRPIFLYYQNEKERAINVVFKRDISKDDKWNGKIEPDTYFDLCSPYGYGGFWGEIENFDLLNETYNKYCIEKGYICEFVRFHLFTNYRAHYDGEVETRTHNVVRELGRPIDDIWMDFKQKVRKNVKRALKNNLEIVIENSNEHLDEFLKIYYSTMERNEAEGAYYFSKAFYEKLIEMKDNIMLFYVLYEGEVISTELVIYGSESCYSYLGGTYQEYFELRPNDFLKFEIIKWANEKGLKNFVLGGGYGADDGIFQYKTCLAPNGIVDFYIGRKVFSQEKYDMLVTRRAMENPDCIESNYFPKYRA